MSKAIQFKKNGENIYPCPYYPVGSIYISVNSTNPGTIFGGTWEQIKGRFLLGTGANDANSTDYWGGMSAGQYDAPVGQKGGECRHQISVAEIPYHYHDIRYGSCTGNGVTISTVGSGDRVLDISNWNWTYNTNNRAGEFGDSGSNLFTRPVGQGKTHNNMPPYLSVYMWKRVG